MSEKDIVNISGVSDSRTAFAAAQIIKEKKKGQVLFIVPSQSAARRLAGDLSFFIDKKVYVLPDEEWALLRYDAKNHDQLLEKMAILKGLREGEDCVVTVPVWAAIKKLPPAGSFEKGKVTLSVGGEVDIEELKKKLIVLGYERIPLVEAKGQFSVRGGIVDIFAADGRDPYRLEFFDTQIDSIRTFDIDTQRSIAPLKEVKIYQAEQFMKDKDTFDKAALKIGKAYDRQIKKMEGLKGEEETLSSLKERKAELLEYAKNTSNIQQLENYIYYFYDETEYIWDYMNEPVIMINDPNMVWNAIEDRSEIIKEDFKVLLQRGKVVPSDLDSISGKKDYLKIYDEKIKADVYLFTPFQNRVKGVERFTRLSELPGKPVSSFNGNMDMFRKELKHLLKQGFDITVVCSTEERVGNINEFLERSSLDIGIKTVLGDITGGMEFPTEKICYISDKEIFGEHKRTGKRRRGNSSKGQTIKSFADMQKGDYVVHENHGIGKFIGIEQLIVQGAKKDYLQIKYAGQDMLYVPVEQMDLIQKYIGAEGARPRVNKLTGNDWKLTKARAKAAIANMAKELLEVSAARQSEPGFAFSQDTKWQKEFEDSFPYFETPDQLRCIEEIKKDMERPVSMDRLLCGDVGFGKTEVAARAMFKCAAEGKQTAVLVPTTILANQHYYTLKDRFEKFPFKVEMLSRFRSEQQQKNILEELRKGSADVVIGTHRLLSKDVSFKDLGLLVIDEEQRFGVKHKEIIKQLRKNVDVLTLSATPIPRTLHMSLVGIKDMSLIEEPPEDRYPIQTYVMEQDDNIIEDVIQRELDRDGQVYVVYNRVRGINKIASHISELVPEAEVAIGHGQMNEKNLEEVLMGFVEGKSNVLVATTIIESGIDIQNVNTIIILDADKYGLSQLYQLRGRVGRTNRLAYAYLMYQRDKSLSEVAEKRLRAIKEFTEFGAGFKVAMRDLEIRGAGNLLGTEQSGQMMNIGYELYCKLVDDAVRALEGNIVNPDREEPNIEINVTAYIPDRYISDEVLKLQMYKKIASIESEEDETELLDELIDRFGDPPKDTLNLIKISRIKAMAIKLEIVTINQRGNKVSFYPLPGGGPSAKAIAEAAAEYKARLFIHGGVKPLIRYTAEGKNILAETVKVMDTMVKNEK